MNMLEGLVCQPLTREELVSTVQISENLMDVAVQ